MIQYISAGKSMKMMPSVVGLDTDINSFNWAAKLNCSQQKQAEHPEHSQSESAIIVIQ